MAPIRKRTVSGAASERRCQRKLSEHCQRKLSFKGFASQIRANNPHAERGTGMGRPATGNVGPSRVGKVHLGGWFHPDTKRSLRFVQAKTDKTIEDLIGRALNDLFHKYNVPVVDQVTGAEDPTTKETNPAA
jgi:hypothetical protein